MNKQQFTKYLAYFLAVVGVIWFLMIPSRILYEEYVIKYQIYKADHSAILAACRNMIVKRHEFRNDKDKYNPNQDTTNFTKLNPHVAPLEDNVPAIIRAMNAGYIEISKEKVFICLSALPRRYIIAFAEGATQYGTERLINGLWYYNGVTDHGENQAQVGARLEKEHKTWTNKY